jgi:hypothetical protein
MAPLHCNAEDVLVVITVIVFQQTLRAAPVLAQHTKILLIVLSILTKCRIRSKVHLFGQCMLPRICKYVVHHGIVVILKAYRLSLHDGRRGLLSAHSFPKIRLKLVDHDLPFDGTVGLSRSGENGEGNDKVFSLVLACLRGTVMLLRILVTFEIDIEGFEALIGYSVFTQISH